MLKLVITTKNLKWAEELREKAVKIFESHNLPFEVFQLSPAIQSKVPLLIKANESILHKGAGLNKLQFEKILRKYISRIQ